MSDELKQNAAMTAHPLLEAIAGNPKASMAAATGTAGLGIDTALLQTLPLILGIIATILGIILTSVLIYRNIKLTIREDREYKQKIKDRKRMSNES